jgi:predicted chitinase
MIQPTMYFYLRYIPLFSGLYLITKVSHSIQPNNVVTNFEGVRMSSLNFPFVSEFVSTITKEILEKGTGTVTPYLTKEDPNWWGNLKDNALKTRIVNFYNSIKTKINNPAVQAAMIAIVYKESKLVPKSESSYAGTNKFKTFNAFANLTPYTTEGPGGIETSQFINELKKKDTTFFNFVYGNKNGNDPKTAKLNPINITDSNGKVITVYDDLNGDGYKYRGRGYNQITGKSLYERAKKDTGVDVVTNPDLLNNINTAALALLGYFERGTTGKVQEPTNKDNLFYKVYSRTPLKDYVPTDYQKAYNTLFSINAGPGKSMEVHLSNDIKKGGYNDGYFILQSIYNAIIAGEIK